MFDKLITVALRCGVSIFDYWEMTIGEINMMIQNYQKVEEDRAKEVIANNYSLAYLTASFTLNGLNGKAIP